MQPPSTRSTPLWKNAAVPGKPSAPAANGRPWLGQPMTTSMRTMRRKSSRFCALKSARTSSVNLVGITTGAFPPTLGYPQ